MSSKDAAIDAALQLTQALRTPHSESVLTTPSLERTETLLKLEAIFDYAVNLENNGEPWVGINEAK